MTTGLFSLAISSRYGTLVISPDGILMRFTPNSASKATLFKSNGDDINSIDLFWQ